MEIAVLVRRYLHIYIETYSANLFFPPTRFTPERKAARHQLAYMPFGIGPRNCIGFRFALLEVKIIMVRMLQKYRFVRCEETEVPLKLAQIFIERPENGVYVQVEKRWFRQW